MTRVVLCSGKVAYDAMAYRDEHAAGTAAVVRIEQLYPWPEDEIAAVLSRYPGARRVVWLQEEPENMGAWSFVHGRLHKVLREDFDLVHVSRSESPSPAAGVAAIHQLETEDILRRALGS